MKLLLATGEWWKQSHLPPLGSDILNENETEDYAMVSVLEIFEPKTYNAAKNSSNWIEWKKAFDEEIASPHENEVWQVVNRSKERKLRVKL